MKNGNEYQGLKLVGQILSAGFTMVTAVAIGYFAGNWLDNYFGTKPWLTITLFILGTAAGLKSLYELSLPKEDKE